MPKPPAEFVLHNLYGGKVQIKEFPNSHTYKVSDAENKRDWEVSPSATGLTGSMDKGAGLMVYAMSESMKYIDRVVQNRSLKSLVEDPDFSFQTMFKKARQAHLDKSSLGKRVGTAAHSYVEGLATAFKRAQDEGTQFIIPAVPRASDLATDLKESLLNILSVYSFDKIETAEKYRQVMNTDIEVRARLWNEAMQVQRACEGARKFFYEAARQGVIRVWAVEKVVHSRKHFFSGRFDLVIEFIKPFVWRGYPIGAGVYVADYKTSNPGIDYPMGFFPSYLPQLGIYDVGYTEEFPAMADRIVGHMLLGSSKENDGFQVYVSLKRDRNRNWGKALVPVMEFMHQGERELKGLNLYGVGK